MGDGACDVPDDDFGKPFGVKLEADLRGSFKITDEAVKAFVDPAHALESGDDFLSYVATFVEIDGGCFQSGFLWKRVFVYLGVPSRNPV